MPLSCSNAMSQFSEWNIFVVVSAWVAILRTTRLVVVGHHRAGEKRCRRIAGKHRGPPNPALDTRFLPAHTSIDI